MSAIDVSPGSRLYAADAGQFGNAMRANVLGLTNTPAIVLDDGTTVAYFGPRRANVVDVAKKKKITDGSSASVPLDVKMVGKDQLDALGIPADQQTSMFAKWTALSDSQRSEFLAKWSGLDKSNADEFRQFVQSMVDTLS